MWIILSTIYMSGFRTDTLIFVVLFRNHLVLPLISQMKNLSPEWLSNLPKGTELAKDRAGNRACVF